MSMKQSPKILDVEATTINGSIKLQAALDVMYLYKLLKVFFEQELLASPAQLIGSQHLQETLNTRAKDIPTLGVYTFDNDMRAIELAVMLSILETTSKTGGHGKDYTILPAWQLPGQNSAMQSHTGKQSWDGLLLGLPRAKDGSAIPIPIELKSLMDNPNSATSGSPNVQLTAKLTQFTSYFQQPGTINTVLVMPYTSETNLEVDLKQASNDLRASMSSQAIGAICVLSFPTGTDGRLKMSILCAVVSQDPSFMRADNHKQWMHEINFGTAS